MNLEYRLVITQDLLSAFVFSYYLHIQCTTSNAIQKIHNTEPSRVGHKGVGQNCGLHIHNKAYFIEEDNSDEL
jgi:hypothetical protein